MRSPVHLAYRAGIPEHAMKAGGEMKCNGKQRFLTKGQAKERLSRRRKEVHQYHCSQCGYWHNGGGEAKRKKILALKALRRKKIDKSEACDG